MKITKLKRRLLNHECILMDGAMGTEILNQGVETKLPLWSAEALLTHPEVVQKIHEAYIKAGAQIITTNTFRTFKRAFAKKGIADKARKATILACKLAQQAREKTKTLDKVFIAGSVAPLEECYSPELTPPVEELEAEHDEYVQDLRDGGVDFILLETMITLRETRAALKAIKKYNLPWAVSFCVNDKNQLLGGESLIDAVKEVQKEKPLFIGINCIDIKTATSAVKYLHKLTPLPVSVYAQGDGGPDDDQGWKFAEKEKQETYLRAVEQWQKDGAQIIGACCGSTPEYIRKIRRLVC